MKDNLDELYAGRSVVDRKLVCEVVGIQYLPSTRKGIVYIAPGTCVDMSGCISLFESIDPEVSEIETYSRDPADPHTFYRRESTEHPWRVSEAHRNQVDS